MSAFRICPLQLFFFSCTAPMIYIIFVHNHLQNFTIFPEFPLLFNITDHINAVNIHYRSMWTHTHNLTALFPGFPGWAGTRKVKLIWILLKQETASGSGISWAICKSTPRSRQITMPAPQHSVFYRPDVLPADQPTASKHWRQYRSMWNRR